MGPRNRWRVKVQTEVFWKTMPVEDVVEEPFITRAEQNGVVCYVVGLVGAEVEKRTVT